MGRGDADEGRRHLFYSPAAKKRQVIHIVNVTLLEVRNILFQVGFRPTAPQAVPVNNECASYS